MTSPGNRAPCDHTELVAALVLEALPESEAVALKAHVVECDTCRQELASRRVGGLADGRVASALIAR